MNRKLYIIGNFFIITAIAGCVSTPPPKTDLPASAALITDTFETLDDSRWARAAMTFDDNQLNNFTLAEERIDNGRLEITTAPGAFSKGGVASKFSLLGNFDVQADVAMADVHQADAMDQRLTLIVGETGNLEGKWASVNIIGGRSRKNGTPYFGIILIESQSLKGNRRGYKDLSGSFDGSLRFVRDGDTVTAYYRTAKDGDWKKLGSVLGFDAKEVTVGVRLSNFIPGRKRIEKAVAITGYVDNFIVNQADGIRDNEI